MKVRELIDKLMEYNANAEFELVINGCPTHFTINYGYSDGCTKNNCEYVSISTLCRDEL